tara:strand:+ start:270 stop:1451 length:1182 start_codon:yes stop_codon:yes gene_type:complete
MSDPYDIDNLLVTVAGMIASSVRRKTLNTSPWLSLVKKETWPDEMADIISVLVYERSLPTSPQTWNTLGYNDGTGSNCAPVAEIIDVGSTTLTYNLQQSALESPPLCVNDLRFSVRRKEQLDNIEGILSDNTAWSWIQRHRDEYVRLSGNKWTTQTPFTNNGSADFGAVEPTSILRQGHLDTIYMQLIRDGAGNSAMGMANGAPQFSVVISPEASEAVIRENSVIREDIRYSSKVDELLAAMGVDRPYKGYYHLQDAFAPRWNYSAGWVWVAPYVATAATKGNKWIINPAYESASYEDTIVFHPEAYKSMVPGPITSPGGGTSFDPQNYMGDFKWSNILHRDINPDGTIGYFRGIFSNGSKPNRPEWAHVIRHQRCGPRIDELSCADYLEYGG